MKKDISINIVRVFAMLLVVFYHSYCCYLPAWGLHNVVRVPLYSAFIPVLSYIHVPLFIVISGYLYSHKFREYDKAKDNIFILKKTKRLLLPYVVWGIFNIILLKSDPTLIFTGVYHLWFLLALFNIFVIIHLTRSYWNKINNLIIIILLFPFISYIISKTPNHNILCLYSTISYIPYFILGIIIERKNMSRFQNYKFLILTIVIMFVLQYMKYMGMSIFKHETTFIICETYLSLYLCYNIVNIFRTKFRTIETHKKISNFIERTSSISMGIYIIHHIIIQYIYRYDFIISLANANYHLYPIILFIVVLFISGFVTFFLQKTFLKVIIA